MNRIQEKELEIFKQIKIILEKYNLRYYAIGGTCIGAVRHKGFIPWDDDIDIAMPRHDYDLFMKKYYKELPSGLLKMDGYNTRTNNYIFGKIHDENTTLVDCGVKYSTERFTGAFVDIMPVDGLPLIGKKKIIQKVNLYSRLNCTVRPWSSSNTTMGYHFKQTIKHIIQIFFRYDKYLEKIDTLMKRFSYDEADEVYFTWRYGCETERKVFKKCFFDELVCVPFEDTTILIPQKYHEYLTQDFGDYMKLPPEEERHSIHDIYICDMDTPYRFYVEQEKKKK